MKPDTYLFIIVSRKLIYFVRHAPRELDNDEPKEKIHII